MNEITSRQEEILVANATKEYLEEEISNDKFVSYIAKFNGKIVSVSGLVVFKRPPYLENLKGMEAYILNMYTLPEYRGKKLAGRLLKKCIEDCKQRGVKRIWLHASEDGKPLYKKWDSHIKTMKWNCFYK